MRWKIRALKIENLYRGLRKGRDPRQLVHYRLQRNDKEVGSKAVIRLLASLIWNQGLVLDAFRQGTCREIARMPLRHILRLDPSIFYHSQFLHPTIKLPSMRPYCPDLNRSHRPQDQFASISSTAFESTTKAKTSTQNLNAEKIN